MSGEIPPKPKWHKTELRRSRPRGISRERAVVVVALKISDTVPFVGANLTVLNNLVRSQATVLQLMINRERPAGNPIHRLDSSQTGGAENP